MSLHERFGSNRISLSFYPMILEEFTLLPLPASFLGWPQPLPRFLPLGWRTNHSFLFYEMGASFYLGSHSLKIQRSSSTWETDSIPTLLHSPSSSLVALVYAFGSSSSGSWGLYSFALSRNFNHLIEMTFISLRPLEILHSYPSCMIILIEVISTSFNVYHSSTHPQGIRWKALCRMVLFSSP